MTVQLKAQLNLGEQLQCKNQGVLYGFILLFKKLVAFEHIWFVVFSIGIGETGKMTRIVHTLQWLGI